MPLTYSNAGVSYNAIDPVKKLAQQSALGTSANFSGHGSSEIAESRGESAYVWKQGSVFMASVLEGLGTKNLIADETRKITSRTYYEAIGYDTVATIINDLVSVGAAPLALHAYWAVGDSAWMSDKKRVNDLIRGWKKACDDARVNWGGGETPALNGIIGKNSCDLGGSAVGIIMNKKNLLTDKKLKAGDRIILLKSNGVNANGLTLARAVAKKLPKGYATKLGSGKIYGEALLATTNIYAKLICDLQTAGIEIHYISNITGHGLRKVMRARQSFAYIIEKLFQPHEVFNFIGKMAGLDDREMYETFNMGQDYAIFLPAKAVKKAMAIVKKNGFVGLDAGYVRKGEKRVIIEPKNIIFEGETLDLR